MALCVISEKGGEKYDIEQEKRLKERRIHGK